MLKFEHTEVVGWEAAIRGMRNPLESWEKSDSDYRKALSKKCDECGKYMLPNEDSCDGCWINNYTPPYKDFAVGPNDLDLMTRLRNAGTDHRKFMRMLVVYVDITGPLYWWKEFDTYKVGTVANSCSTMHCIHKHEFTREDFSYEHLMSFDEVYGTDDKISYCEDCGTYSSPLGILEDTIRALNFYRRKYLETKSKPMKDEKARQTLMKKYWWQMIQLLPTSYNQKRTIMMSYEVLANIAREGSRKFHKQDEWRVDFMNWIKSLPYSELITAPVPQKGHEELQNYKEMFEQLKKIMEEKHSVTVCELCNIHDCGDSDEEHCKKCQFYKYSKWANWKKANPVIDEFERKGYTRTVDGNKIVYTKEDNTETNEGLNKHFGGIEE